MAVGGLALEMGITADMASLHGELLPDSHSGLRAPQEQHWALLTAPPCWLHFALMASIQPHLQGVTLCLLPIPRNGIERVSPFPNLHNHISLTPGLTRLNLHSAVE